MSMASKRGLDWVSRSVTRFWRDLSSFSSLVGESFIGVAGVRERMDTSGYFLLVRGLATVGTLVCVAASGASFGSSIGGKPVSGSSPVTSHTSGWRRRIRWFDWWSEPRMGAPEARSWRSS